MTTELISHIATRLVDKPEAVTVREKAGEESGSLVIELTVAKEDLGKVIGKQGRTARAIRTLLAAVAEKEQKRALLRIVE